MDWAEGFGLPLIEAAQRSLPIVARDIPVFREVASQHAFYFHGDEVEDLAKGLRTWLDLFRLGAMRRRTVCDDSPGAMWRRISRAVSFRVSALRVLGCGES